MFYVTGDIHGSGYDLKGRLYTHGISEGTVFCLGDVGLKYGYTSNSLLSTMERNEGIVFLVMRGNHDVRYQRDIGNGTYLSDFEKTEWMGLECLADPKAPNILYLPDEGGMFELNGKKCLIIPGAYSVDKWYRLRVDLPYEDEELLTAAEMDRLIGLSEEPSIEYVFSHTAPLSWERHFRDMFLPGLDQSMIDKSMERGMDVILDNVSGTLKGWYFGHFHDDRTIADGIGHMMYTGIEEIDDLSVC